MEINDLCFSAHANAKEHGFYEDLEILTTFEDEPSLLNQAKLALISKRLMLIVCEVAEAMESLRNRENDGGANFREELADVTIRIFDICGWLNIHLGEEIIIKMAHNKTRPYKHGKLL